MERKKKTTFQIDRLRLDGKTRILKKKKKKENDFKKEEKEKKRRNVSFQNMYMRLTRPAAASRVCNQPYLCKAEIVLCLSSLSTPIQMRPSTYDHLCLTSLSDNSNRVKQIVSRKPTMFQIM